MRALRPVRRYAEPRRRRPGDGLDRALRSLALMFVLLARVVLSAPASAAPGDLDPSFGTGGWVAIHFVGAPYVAAADVVVQPDGKIVVAGTAFNRFAIARYLPSGDLDSSFGNAGKTLISFKPARSRAFAISVESDGRLIVARSVGGGPHERAAMAVARLLPDGSLDPTFGGGDGRASVHFNASVDALAVEVRADGGVLLAGSRWGLGRSRAGFAIAHLTPTGVLDTSSGSAGRATCGIGRYSIDEVAFDGSMVVATGAGPGRFVVARCNVNGLPDLSFASKGFRRFELGPNGDVSFTHVAVDQEGRIVVGLGGVGSCSVVRLTTAGSLDTTFSSDGVATVGYYDCSGNVTVQVDGKIILDGGTPVGAASGEDNCFFARFAGDGSPDPTFGSDGSVVVPGPGGLPTYPCGSSLVQPDGRIVALSDFFDNTMRVVRLLAT